VFSLTNWKQRVFRGGETVLLRDEVLDFWHDFASVRGVEEGELIRTIEPRFNRLSVFDPRIPHGVREVRGTHDPREGRLVIHGWFVQPRPFVQGPLSARILTERIGDLTERLGGWLGALPIAGLYSAAFTVDRRGHVHGVRALSDTTRVPRAERERGLSVVSRWAMDGAGTLPPTAEKIPKNGLLTRDSFLSAEPGSPLDIEVPIGSSQGAQEPKGKGVLLTVIHRRLPDRSTMLKVSAGWHMHLDVLLARASGDEPAPFWEGWSKLQKEYDRRLPA